MGPVRAALALVCGLVACQTQEHPAAGADAASVVEFLGEYRAALDSGDTARVRQLYVSDARFRWLEDGEVRYPTVDALLAGLAGLPEGMTIRTAYGEPRVTLLGERWATAETEFESVFDAGPDARFEVAGVSSMVLERTDGGWRILSGHSSSVSEASDW